MFKSLLGISPMPEPRKQPTDGEPNHGVYLGKDNTTDLPIILSKQELNQHTFLCGTTGSGKTTTIYCFIEYGLKENLPIAVIDGKGDQELTKTLSQMAKKHNRTFELFSITQTKETHNYNPLSYGGPTELKDRLMELSEWKEPHYQYMAERYLQLAFTLYEKAYKTFDLYTFILGLAPEKLEQLANELQAPQSITDYLHNINKKSISGLIDRLTLIIESEIGHLFSIEPDRTISLLDSIAANKIILFSLDSLAYPLYSRLLGRLIINDLKAAASRRKKEDSLVLTIYDEFNVFASRNIIDLINKTRSKGFAALIATQSLADLDIVDVALKKQIIQNCNTIIIQRQNDSEDAEELAKIIGTEQTWMLTHQFDHKGGTGLGSIRYVKEFIIHPDTIKRLQIGQAVIARKIPKFQTHQTTIKKVL